MNLLKKAFTSWEYQFRAAVKAQDATEVASLLDQMHVPLEEREMTLLAEEANRDVLATYFEKVKDKGGWGWMFPPINHCLTDGALLDRVDVMLEAGIDFNREHYNKHPVTDLILCCPAERQRRLEWLEKMTAGGIENISDKERFLKLSVSCNFPEAVDLFVRLGLDLRANCEEALRKAAASENREMCLYLIEKHGADLEWARLKAGFGSDDGAVCQFLSDLQAELKPSPSETPNVPPKKPVTLETLSEDLKKLRDMVADLTQKVVELQNPVVRLDKPSQKVQP